MGVLPLDVYEWRYERPYDYETLLAYVYAKREWEVGYEDINLSERQLESIKK